jgi:hypothetical protein
LMKYKQGSEGIVRKPATAYGSSAIGGAAGDGEIVTSCLSWLPANRGCLDAWRIRLRLTPKSANSGSAST